jgi:hypothetical protein
MCVCVVQVGTVWANLFQDTSVSGVPCSIDCSSSHVILSYPTVNGCCPTSSMSEHNNISEELNNPKPQDPKHQQHQPTKPKVPQGASVTLKGDFRKEWKVQPGYSSGASSYSGSDADWEDGENDGSTLLRSHSTLEVSSHHSDILDLSTLRKEMMAEGDLTKTVVRIEVRHTLFLVLVHPQRAKYQCTHTFVSLSFITLLLYTPILLHSIYQTPFGKPIEEIYDGVHDGPVLGSGVSGIVRLVAHRATGIKYAVKCLDIGLIDSTEGLRQLRDEIFIMCQLDHPNIVRIDEVYESTNEIYIVQELCHGGDLFDRLDEQPDYHYTEAQCARLVKQMLSSVRYLHSKGVIHRDLKLENFLFSSTKPESELKMIDFGLSKHFLLGEHHHEKGK